jgi:hypothetical protein
MFSSASSEHSLFRYNAGTFLVIISKLSPHTHAQIMFTIDMNFRPENNLERLVTITFGELFHPLLPISKPSPCKITKIHERQLASFSLAGCIGAVLVLFSLSTVCIIIHETLSLQQKTFRKKVDHVNDFIRRKRIPDPLAARQM